MHYIIPSSKLNEDQKKVFAENRSVFSPKLGEELGLFCLIIQRSNLDGVTPKSRWEDAKSRWGDASPYNLSIVVNQNEGQGPPGPRSDGAEFAKRQNFFFHRNKDLYLLFYPRLSLILSGCLFLHLTFFGTFAKC